MLSDWGHAWHPALEMAQFQAANKRRFSERQYIFRVRGSGPLTTLIVPRRAGGAPTSITQKGESVEYRTAAKTEGVLGKSFAALRSNSQTTLTAFASAPASAYGMTLAGGPAEISLKYNHLFIAIQGQKGRREFTVPGKSDCKGNFKSSRAGITLVDSDGKPPEAVLDPKN